MRSINFLNEEWKKLKTLFDKTDERQVLQIDKELISLDHLSLEGSEYYLSHVKETWLKLGEYILRFFEERWLAHRTNLDELEDTL